MAEALIAERGGRDRWLCLFFPTFSSFLTRASGSRTCSCAPPIVARALGRALLSAVAARVHERGGERLEWAALDWNELALGFYRRMGATTASEWITHRLDGEALVRCVAERRRASDRR